MALPNDSITVTPGTGATVATQYAECFMLLREIL